MKAPASDLRLLLFGAALLIFGGGLTFAVARWNSAATDRAFVEAAERAARHRPPPPGPPRFWAPVTGAQPPAPITAEIVRREASLPPPAATVPQAPGDKPPAAPR